MEYKQDEMTQEKAMPTGLELVEISEFGQRFSVKEESLFRKKDGGGAWKEIIRRRVASRRDVQRV